MKFQRMKDMICGALIASMVLCSGTVAFAKVANMNIPVSFSNIKIVVDGEQISTSKEPFTYEGTTYLSVRAVAEAVGKDVTWDGNTKTVYLGKLPSGTENQTQNAASEITLKDGHYTAGKDFPVGKYNIVCIEGFGNVYSNNAFDGGLNEIMATKDYIEKNLQDSKDFYSAEYKNCNFSNGDVLTVSRVTIKLVPVS